ncbi:hypothetical protein ACFVIM_34540 [Streptomyces sp. NPDC057638]|uniref:hypothetical protein n=1 Tax=Streptomyces sp. NPDC057638 TaxID=3346190 RepID=UPI0036C8E833
MTTLTSPSGKTYRAEIVTDWDHGVVAYDVDRAGAFTLVPDERDADRIDIVYGRPAHAGSFPEADHGWTAQPTIGSIAISGRARIRVSEMERFIARRPDGRFGWHVWMERPSRLRPLKAERDAFAAATVTDTANLGAAQLVAAIARHHAARPDRSAVIWARAAAQAPARIRDLELRRAAAFHRAERALAEVGVIDGRIADLGALVAPRAAELSGP